jgi:hypothetical protein
MFIKKTRLFWLPKNFANMPCRVQYSILTAWLGNIFIKVKSLPASWHKDAANFDLHQPACIWHSADARRALKT